jgi:hypothetical protein
LLSLLDVIALEVSDWNLVASNILVHYCVIISTSWLCYLLGDLVVHNLICWISSLRLADIHLWLLLLLLLLQNLDPLELLLEFCPLSIDILVQHLLVLVKLVDDKLLVQLSSIGSSHGSIVHVGLVQGSLRVGWTDCILAEEALAFLKTHSTIILPSTVRR